MSPTAAKPLKARRRLALALLATAGAAALLGGCGQTDKLFSKLGASSSDEVQLSAADAAGAVAQWGAAYLKNPQDPRMAMGYAKALKAIGSRDRALEILKIAYQSNTTDGEIAAELGRLALDMGQMDIASVALKSAEAQGVKDWKTLSAEGTLHAKKGEYAEAQQYFLAALQVEPDAVSVTNNLALAYALDGKADKAEGLLREAVASGHEDKRVRQNLALVLGLEGKFDEARQIASVDMTEQEAKSSMTYLHNMLSSPNAFASAKDNSEAALASAAPKPSGGDDWQPYAANSAAEDAPVRTAAATPAAPAKVQVVTPIDEIEAPAAAKFPGAKPMPAPAKVASAASLASAKAKPAPAAPTPITPNPEAQGLLRTNLD
jgi:Flp pilus assembly protein TadD